jgi:hypothetical protein
MKNPARRFSGLNGPVLDTLWGTAPHEDEDDDEYDLGRISAVKIDTVPRRLGEYMLFCTHFKDEKIPLVGHRLNEVQRTSAFQYFLDSPNWLDFACRQKHMDFMRTSHPARLPHSQ